MRTTRSNQSSRPKPAPPGDELVEIEGGDLDRFERPDVEGSFLRLVLSGVVEQVELAPRPALQQAVVLVDEVLGHVHELVVEVLQVRPELVLPCEQPDVDLVDEPVLALLLDPRLGQLGLVGTDEVLPQCLIDDSQPGLDRRRHVGGAVLAQQELQHVDRNVGAHLDLTDEVLAYDAPREGVVGEFVEPVELHHRISRVRPSSVTGAATGTDADASAKPVRASITCRSTSVPETQVLGDLDGEHAGPPRVDGHRPALRIVPVAGDDPCHDRSAARSGNDPHRDLVGEQVAVEGQRGGEHASGDSLAGHGDADCQRAGLGRLGEFGHDHRDDQFLRRQATVEELPAAASPEHRQSSRHNQVEVARSAARGQGHPHRGLLRHPATADEDTPLGGSDSAGGGVDRSVFADVPGSAQ